MARNAHDGNDPRGTAEASAQGVWQRAAAECPHAVQVLTLAAEAEIVHSGGLVEGLFPEDGGSAGAVPESAQDVIDEHRKRLLMAEAWLSTAIAESHRRDRRPPRGAFYYRAYARTALSDFEGARQALAEAVEAADVQTWRAQRMGALVELLAGDLDRALRLAQLGVVNAPTSDRSISRYIRALVLDRSGAPDAARAELLSLRAQAGVFPRLAMESVLPVHEVMFSRALYHQAHGNRSAALRLWQEYLERPEVAEPERVLAQRHLQQLQAPVPPAGGP